MSKAADPAPTAIWPSLPALSSALAGVWHEAFPAGALPGRSIELGSADLPWDPEAHANRAAAVVLLLIPPALRGGAARVVLTRRSTTVRSHRGQVGFAGGRIEAGDTTPAATALRELEEELGVPRERVLPLGTLPTIGSLDGGPVVPVIAITTVDLPAMVPAPAEVDRVWAEPWTEFLRARDRTFSFNIFGRWRTSHLFERLADAPDGAPFRVWGLTAAILAGAELG